MTLCDAGYQTKKIWLEKDLNVFTWAAEAAANDSPALADQLGLVLGDIETDYQTKKRWLENNLHVFKWAGEAAAKGSPELADQLALILAYEKTDDNTKRYHYTKTPIFRPFRYLIKYNNLFKNKKNI